MTNRAFIQMPTDSRLKKLRANICERTNGALTAEELRRLLLSVKLTRQYRICVHTDPQDFRRAIILHRAGNRRDNGRIAFGRALFGECSDVRETDGDLFTETCATAAIVTQTTLIDGRTEYLNRIHIYIPEKRFRRGGVQR